MPTSTETASGTMSGSGNEGKGRFSPQPVGLLLGKFGLLILLAGFLLAAWYGQTVIVVLLGLALTAAGLAKLWSRFSYLSK